MPITRIKITQLIEQAVQLSYSEASAQINNALGVILTDNFTDESRPWVAFNNSTQCSKDQQISSEAVQPHSITHESKTYSPVLHIHDFPQLL